MADLHFYRDLSAEEVAALDRVTTTAEYRRGELLDTPAMGREGLLVLGRGRVIIYRLTAAGQKLVIATAGPGSILVLRWLTGPATGGFAEAVEDSRLCVITRTDLERLIAAHPRLALRLLEALTTRLEETEARLVTLAFRGVPARLAATLLRLADEGGRAVHGQTHQHLAELVGASRETVTRVLNDFQTRGFVDLRRGALRILDPAGLQQLTEG